MINARGIYVVLSFVVSIYLAYQWGHLLESSSASISALIDVFSILAGVLVAVISIIGDPSMLLPGNWRVGWQHAQDMQIKISNYSNLFAIYVSALILLVLCNFVKDNNLVQLKAVFPLAAGFSVFGLLISIFLPYSLMAIQKERMEEEVKERKRKKDTSRKNAAPVRPPTDSDGN